jgi:ACS family tartrate transporter-like MFS transporter
MVLYLTYWFPKSYRARLISNFMLAIPFANMVGGPVSGFILGMDGLSGLHGWQWLFLLEGLPACIIALTVLAMLPSTPREASWLTAEEKAAIAARLACEDVSHHQRFWPALRDVHVWALGFVYLGYSISYYGVQLWLPQIVQAMGFSNLATSFLVALPFAATMATMFYWGRSSDASGERIWHVAIPALIAMTSLLVASATGSNLVVFLALSFAVMSLMSLQGPFWSLPQSYLSGVAAAGGIALINTIGTGAGGFIGPYVVGILKDATGGYAVPMAVLAAAPAMTAIVVLSLKKSVAPQTAIAS